MRYIRTLIPTDFTFRTALILAIYVALAIWDFFDKSVTFSESANLKFGAVVTTGLLGATLFDLYLRRGYKVSYDAATIYWRKVGFRGKLSNVVAMPFDSITDVFAEPGSLGVRPFEAAVLRADKHDVSDIYLSRLYLRREDIIELLAEVSEKSNAAFEDHVREFVSTR